MKPDEIVRCACITAYNMDLDTYEWFGFPKGRFKEMQMDFGKWFCRLDSNNAEKFMNYTLERCATVVW